MAYPHGPPLEGPSDAGQTGEAGHGRYASPVESVSCPFVTRGRRELVVSLTAQPVFDLERQVPMARRLRRIVRHGGGEPALRGLGRRTLETADLRRIDLLTLRHGLDLLNLGPEFSGVMPAFWRTAATSHGRFALLYAGLQHRHRPGMLLVEVQGGAETAAPEALADVMAHLETEALGVILHIAPDVGALRRLAGSPVKCLAIDFAGVDHAGAKAWAAATDLIESAREAAPRLMLLNLRPDRGPAAAYAGATHAVFAHMDPFTV